MPNYRVQTVLKSVDLVPANFVTNTWYVDADTVPDLATPLGEIQAIYGDSVGYLSPLIAQNGHENKVYDMADPEPRAPIIIQTWNLASAPSGTALPPEVCLCLSFQGARVSGLPQARRRGRIYFGPLDTTALGSDGRPAGAFITSLRNSASDFLTLSNAATTWKWKQYSRVNDGFSTVEDGWVDNEFDVQRRRGRAWTSRTLFT